MIDIFLECINAEDVKYEEMISKAATAVLECENHNFDAEISVTLTNNEEIREINSEHRGIDKETDVLSFPLYDFESPSVFDEKQVAVDGDVRVLGDIVISVEKIIAQAQEYGHSVEREMCYMTVHSMLHLLGYDHMTEDDKKLMRSREDAVMEYLNIKR